MPTAIEELLRAYSPVTMARIVTEDIEVEGCPMKAGDRVLMNFPAANRDPEVFDGPRRGRARPAVNRHLAFGVGIHRCAGSNLARMELRVAIEEWFRRIPEFLGVPTAPRSPGPAARSAGRARFQSSSTDDWTDDWTNPPPISRTRTEAVKRPFRPPTAPPGASVD